MIRQQPVVVGTTLAAHGRYKWVIYLAPKNWCALIGTTSYATRGATVAAGRRAFKRLFDRGDMI